MRDLASLLLFLPVLAAACIERPETPAVRRSAADRSSLGGVLLASLPQARYPVGAVFGDAVELVGLDVTPDPVPHGARATVTSYLRVTGELDDDWKVFVHLDDEARAAPRVNADHWPAGDRYRTSAWRKGDIVRDTWSFVAPAGSVERLELWTGFYKGDDRLPLTSAGRARSDGGNRVRAVTLPLR